jgi:hypothetical protein
LCRTDSLPGDEHHLSLPYVFASATHVLTRVAEVVDADLIGGRSGDVFLTDDTVGPGGKGGAGEDPCALALGNLPGRHLTGGDLLHDA